ncbi:MAG: PQQ-dependent sugar dehydrogenase [Chloroflexi bacterium]|nr:PQQ-dependent sugar dehydrogenase [Chloroflexota bacterium]
MKWFQAKCTATALVMALASAIMAGCSPAPPPGPSPSPGAEPIMAREAVATLATGLEAPWAADFLPDGGIIFTERPGRIRLLDAGGALIASPLRTIEEVAHRGEGGLLGLALHPDFDRNQSVYVYHTYQSERGLANRVVRLKFRGGALVDDSVIIDGIPGAGIHDGGHIKFGPDSMLYITTGDASVAILAQERASLAGKILRLKDDGTVPDDNPFPGSPVYSLGHRNPQGLAWDDREQLWATEHGSSATDELNLIIPGGNYGWPTIRGDERAEGLISPVLHSGGDTWAPSGMAFAGGSLYFAGLRGQSLFRVSLSGHEARLSRHLEGELGRLREVVAGPDGFLYVLTNNRDGRGAPAADDDRIIRIDPARL